MNKWEYLVTVLRQATLAEKEETLSELGDQGWELVAITDTVREWQGEVTQEAAEKPAGKANSKRSVDLHAAQRPVIAYLKRPAS
jgi:hypothetical protein